MIRLKVLYIAIPVLLLITGLTYYGHRWWTEQKIEANDGIAARDRATKASDLAIKIRDKRMDSLRVADSLKLKSAVMFLQRKLDTAQLNYASAKAQIDADAATHEGLVPLVTVHQLEAKADSTILDCSNLSAEKSTRIDNLLAQLAGADTTRAQQDTTRTRSDSTRTDLDRQIHPPFLVRVLHFIEDAGVILGATGIGILIGKFWK